MFFLIIFIEDINFTDRWFSRVLYLFFVTLSPAVRWDSHCPSPFWSESSKVSHSHSNVSLYFLIIISKQIIVVLYDSFTVNNVAIWTLILLILFCYYCEEGDDDSGNVIINFYRGHFLTWINNFIILEWAIHWSQYCLIFWDFKDYVIFFTLLLELWKPQCFQSTPFT